MSVRERRGGGFPHSQDPRDESAQPRVYSRAFLDSFWGRGPGSTFPMVDVSEDDEHYVVTAELPGVGREDVAVELEHGALTMRGEKRCEREAGSARVRSLERSFGSFSRTIALPPDADSSRVQAALRDGVLTVTVAKRGERGPRKVEIETS